jgi:hypothetical protein
MSVALALQLAAAILQHGLNLAMLLLLCLVVP